MCWIRAFVLIGIAVAAAVFMPRVAVPLLRPLLIADRQPVQERPVIVQNSIVGFSFVLLIGPFIVLAIIVSGMRKAAEAGEEPPTTTLPLALAVALLVPAIAAVLLAYLVVSILAPRGNAPDDWLYNVVTFAASVVTAFLVDFRFPSLFPKPPDKATWYGFVIGLPLAVISVI